MPEAPEKILVSMFSDQQVSYKLSRAVKWGALPPDLKEIRCGKISDSRWLTTARSLVYMWTRNDGLSGKDLDTLQILVKYACSCTSCCTVISRLITDFRTAQNIS